MVISIKLSTPNVQSQLASIIIISFPGPSSCIFTSGIYFFHSTGIRRVHNCSRRPFHSLQIHDKIEPFIQFEYEIDIIICGDCCGICVESSDCRSQLPVAWSVGNCYFRSKKKA